MKSFPVFSLVASVLGSCPDAAKETCLRGGKAAETCTGMSCPPCWVPQGANKWDCFEKLNRLDNTKACPPWEGLVDITMLPSKCKDTKPLAKRIICPDVSKNTCYGGGDLNYPCQGANCAPCWEYVNNQWNCWAPHKFVCSGTNQIDIRDLPANCEFLG
ncbi:hypothetical protein DSO57_1033852 [Entomophthora muscae]|uniref:Uncharacterized protein n=1 Tax=Entomophthora muscae TaxID=34485 RepID=A0ACC2TYQ5_9FUNG|nr:hypothetical protein DSO57_1033852 [Entomophthora muscae]